jgi:hypothetical protein
MEEATEFIPTCVAAIAAYPAHSDRVSAPYTLWISLQL